MTGVAPTPPAGAPTAAGGIAASVRRRGPDEADRPAAPDPAAPRRSPSALPPGAAAPDPEGQRGRLIDVFA